MISPSSRSRLYLICLAVAVFYALISWQLLSETNALTIILFVIFSYSMLRIIYELSWNIKNITTIPTGFFDRRRIAEILKNHFSDSTCSSPTIVDLGSGRGELSRVIARALPHAKVVGYEIAPFAHCQATLFQKLFGPSNVMCRNADFFKEDLRFADAVILYLSGRVTQEAGVKLANELQTGALVIANEFPLGGAWTPDETLTFHTPFETKLYLYKKRP